MSFRFSIFYCSS